MNNKIDELRKKKTLMKSKETILKNKKGESDMGITEQNNIDIQTRKSKIDFLSAVLQRTTTLREI